MPRFVYVGDDVRDFPSVPCTVAPGDVIEADDNPHTGYFQPELAKAVPAEDVKE